MNNTKKAFENCATGGLKAANIISNEEDILQIIEDLNILSDTPEE